MVYRDAAQGFVGLVLAPWWMELGSSVSHFRAFRVPVSPLVGGSGAQGVLELVPKWVLESLAPRPRGPGVGVCS